MGHWKKYTGDYKKIFYDVKDKDGNIYLGCRPNAGYMHTLDGSDLKFEEKDNIMIRVSEKNIKPY